MQIYRTRGDTYADRLQVSNSSSGEIANISGCSFKMTLNSEKNPIDETSQVYQLIGVITDPMNGIVEFTPTEEQANQVGIFYYDIQMTDSAGVKRTLVKDVYQYIQDITKN